MKKRILSLMLAFLFVFALTAPVSAIIDVYHEVSITNVPLPNEGSLYPGTAGISTSPVPLTVISESANAAAGINAKIRSVKNSDIAFLIESTSNL